MTPERDDRIEKRSRGMFVSPHEILGAQIDALYATSTSTAIMSALGAVIIAAQLPASHRIYGIIFVAATAALLFARFILLAAYNREKRKGDVFDIWWAKAATLLSGVAGILWGGITVLAIHVGSEAVVLTGACIALGAVMMSVASISFYPAFLVFELSVVGSAALAFLTSGRAGHMPIGIAAVMLTVALAIAGRSLADRIVSSMRLAVENRELIGRLSDHANALERANNELKILSRTDGLTSLANRRHFIETSEREWSLAAQRQTSLALLAIDVDHFKLYNDRHGHAAGDACLKVVASALQRTVRSGNDIAARPGGEEFALLISEMTIRGALTVAERVRTAVSAATSAATAAGTLPDAATVSIGLALARPAEAGTLDIFMAAADAALYRAKAAGRNRISVASYEEVSRTPHRLN